MTPIKAKLIKHVAGNFIKAKNDLFKPNTENNRQNWKKVTAWHFEFWGSVLKNEGYLTLIRAKLIKYFAGNIPKTWNDLSKPHTEYYGPKWKKVTSWHKIGF